MKRIIPVLVLVLGVASTAGASDVITGCYKKANGQFRILLPPKTCQPSEVAVSLLSATATPAAMNASPLVYDANDQFLGVGQPNELYIPSLRLWTTLNLQDVSGDIWSGQLYYRSDDCTGQPYAEYEYLHRVFGIGQPDERQHYTPAPELEGYLQFDSYADGSGSCRTFDFLFMTMMSRAVPVALPFNVPVALPTKLVNP